MAERQPPEERISHPELPQLPGSPLELEGVEKALLALSYGVHVIGSRSGDGTLNAMLADWVMQVSFKPRLVAVSIENDARTLRFIRETNAFTVNLLHEKDGLDIARKVVMPSEAKKVRGRSDEAASQVIDKAGWHSVWAARKRLSCAGPRPRAGFRARRMPFTPLATTRSSSGAARMARGFVPVTC